MKRALTAALLTLAASFAAVAQEAPSQQGQQSPALTQGERTGARHRGSRHMRTRMRMRRDGMRAMRQLNLNEQQVAQMRSQREAARQATQAQREELRQL